MRLANLFTTIIILYMVWVVLAVIALAIRSEPTCKKTNESRLHQVLLYNPGIIHGPQYIPYLITQHRYLCDDGTEGWQ